MAAFLFAACNNDDGTEEQKRIDEERIKQYISDNNLNAVHAGDGLYYVMDVEGNGKSPNRASTVSVRYKGYRLDGFVFDEKNAPIQFELGNVIKGWREGLIHFKEGGKGMLLIPSHLGYGSDSSADIPANSVLIFDIELVAVFG